ncbi:MAG: dTDP-4-dehydrorhamnose 3,5-epimerase family protein [Bacteroidetes bacterium]|nr:dTDP-4-dehydrorhamnose 3,5-epimerase family protein [Bacteroidota bacterium]
MIFHETKLKGAFIIKPEKKEDERGFFARTFSQDEFLAHGLNATIVQSDISHIRTKGTFRGMHFQAPPFEEDKIVSCYQGAILDFIVDLRSESPTFKEWIKNELSSENGHSIYIPKSFAHGFYTLSDNTQVCYLMTQYHRPEHAWGFRFDDPAFDISVPDKIANLSEKDRSYPDLYLLPS